MSMQPRRQTGMAICSGVLLPLSCANHSLHPAGPNGSDTGLAHHGLLSPYPWKSPKLNRDVVLVPRRLSENPACRSGLTRVSRGSNWMSLPDLSAPPSLCSGLFCFMRKAGAHPRLGDVLGDLGLHLQEQSASPGRLEKRQCCQGNPVWSTQGRPGQGC